jgi:TraM recognition site of TraD and TraG
MLTIRAIDSAMAWPVRVRGLLPGPVGMYFCLGLVVAAPLALGCSVRRSRPGTRQGSWRSYGSTRTGWASRWQIRALAVRPAAGIAADRPGGMLDPRLLGLDEAGNIAAIPDLPELATTGRGQGIQLLSIFHDLGQVHHRYGKQAATVLNGHRAKLFLSGQADTSSLKLAAELLGETMVTETSISSGDARRSRTASVRRRPLAPPARLRQLRPPHAVLVYGHLPPVRVRLRAWWRTPGLARRGGESR